AGNISLPTDFRKWPYLGSWAVSKDGKVHELHNVYAQPGTVEAYRMTGKFPDGAGRTVNSSREAAT
ncbi:MAG: cytochrome P460 family protein, partial [Anaerolineae bacterium]